MEPKLTIIDTNEGISALIVYLADKDFVAYDTETDGTHKGATVIGLSVCASEDEAFYIITHAWDGTELVDIGLDKSLIKELLALMVTKQLVMHNGIFDCARTVENYGIELIQSLHTDTMILAHLLNENRRVGLKELSTEYFGADSTDEQAEMKASVIANGGKLTKSCYEMFKADCYLLGKYGAKDAWLTYKLFFVLIDDLVAQDLVDFFYKDESMPLLKGPTYQLNTTGLKVDQAALTLLKKTLESECAEAKYFIETEIQPYIQDKYPGTNKKNKFNLGSNQQLAWLLFGKLELEFGYLTDGGKKLCQSLGIKIPYTKYAKKDFITTIQNAVDTISAPEAIVNGKKVRSKKVKEPWSYIAVDKKTLTKLAPKYKWIERLLEYQKKNKILKTYVNGIESRMQYGIIRPSFLMHGTTSGRYASRDPNFQNLPRDDKRVKNCFVSRPGKSFVGADFSQLEPRVFAYVSQDKRLMEAFNGDKDFYSVIGMSVYNKTDCLPIKDGHPDAFGVKYKKLRDLSKVIALASTYGATAHQLAPTTGKSVDDTQLDMDNYFEEFPDVAKMMLESHELAKTNGQVTNLFGRPRRMPEALKIKRVFGNIPHAELPYEARNVLNLAVNHRIQSTGASICNRAMIKFYNDIKELGIDCQIVSQVHDEIIVECRDEDTESVTVLLQNAMETAVELPGVPLQAIPAVSKTLGGLK